MKCVIARPGLQPPPSLSSQPKIDLIRSKGLSVESSQDYIVNAIAAKLIGIYNVSNDVLNKRISKELEKGYLSLE